MQLLKSGIIFLIFTLMVSCGGNERVDQFVKSLEKAKETPIQKIKFYKGRMGSHDTDVKWSQTATQKDSPPIFILEKPYYLNSKDLKTFSLSLPIKSFGNNPHELKETLSLSSSVWDPERNGPVAIPSKVIIQKSKENHILIANIIKPIEKYEPQNLPMEFQITLFENSKSIGIYEFKLIVPPVDFDFKVVKISNEMFEYARGKKFALVKKFSFKNLDKNYIKISFPKQAAAKVKIAGLIHNVVLSQCGHQKSLRGFSKTFPASLYFEIYPKIYEDFNANQQYSFNLKTGEEFEVAFFMPYEITEKFLAYKIKNSTLTEVTSATGCGSMRECTSYRSGGRDQNVEICTQYTDISYPVGSTSIIKGRQVTSALLIPKFPQKLKLQWTSDFLNKYPGYGADSAGNSLPLIDKEGHDI